MFITLALRQRHFTIDPLRLSAQKLLNNSGSGLHGINVNAT